ncbi:MAG: hypothetical protein IT426_12125 [Pirellulales bacterium]|nr:hypothetical protein [Pirellulales bacterium]
MTRYFTRRRFLRNAAAGALAASIGAPRALRAAEDRWGDLTGRFLYDGKPPERKKLTVDKDLECCGKFDIRDESLSVAADGGLANVYIYLRSVKVPIHPELEKTAAKQVLLDNLDCIFQPHCLTIWYSRQELHIVNSDPVAQNVAFSPLGDAPANIVLAVGADATHKFARKQNAPVHIACNYHPWESGWILPRDNPYMAVSKKDGAFAIAKLPVGEWEFQAWHERTENLARSEWPKGRFKIAVKPGKNDLGTIALPPKMFEKGGT